ncbi:uncharacterized protein EI90DRAFT_3026975 [Cantharellus anzutake]|uniref:uncharacterized protein n=1 Tax=Cantharellus anzutake TaxID=1750568 RepID=UPI001907DF3B|nr:uncharacterized protein EI90DRAFT_3026975 [Cantharellus anzutake]KAF8305401.1 hypothetical protein EI90DRAFT_3026975 [Cantharellus anzutake]
MQQGNYMTRRQLDKARKEVTRQEEDKGRKQKWETKEVKKQLDKAEADKVTSQSVKTKGQSDIMFTVDCPKSASFPKLSKHKCTVLGPPVASGCNFQHEVEKDKANKATREEDKKTRAGLGKKQKKVWNCGTVELGEGQEKGTRGQGDK